jgi:CheY-like chemotaxis protein
MHMPDADGLSFVEQARARFALDDVKVVMLTSERRPGDVDRGRTLGVVAHLLKPVRQDQLLRTVQAAIGRPPAPAARRSDAPPAVPSRPLRVLVAEDNPVNQRLAEALLARRGHEVVLVGNGREAMAACAAGPFDLVFMDVQMPEMDGFEATAAIRASEGRSGAHVPIVAMTAHAMRGDRERCLASGMDDYITKPISLSEVDRVLQRVATQALTIPN